MKISTIILFPFILICLIFNQISTPNIGELLASRLHNDLYEKFDTVAFDSVFVKEVNILSDKNPNTQKIKDFYAKLGYKPNLVLKFFEDKSLDSLAKYLKTSNQHGFKANLFDGNEIEKLIAKLKSNDFKKVDDCYPLLARLEILSADAYTRYIYYLRFGLVNPKALYDHYDINLKPADSLFHIKLLSADNMIDTLRASQYISSQYAALQHTFLSCKNDSVKKILSVNMERLRWDLPNTGRRFIQVNIPDFRLVYFDGMDTLTSMKVCVGGPREVDYDKKLKNYQKTDKLKDRPENHETPLLFSTIKKVYTNPVWNIPESIAETEVYTMIRKNSGYLKNKNIAVYYKNKRVKNPSSIRWWKYDQKKLPFLFVQQPGVENSLGRMKFIFPNRSSVYLHDTNFKQGFKLANRAISHGCIRVEKPLELAKLLVSDSSKYDEIRVEMKLKPIYNLAKYLQPKDKLQKNSETLSPLIFFPKEDTNLLITYFTAWAHNNKIEYRKDIYGMDKKLWFEMQRLL